MMKDESLAALRSANLLMRSGRFSEAAQAYEELERSVPRLAPMVRANVVLLATRKHAQEVDTKLTLGAGSPNAIAAHAENDLKAPHQSHSAKVIETLESVYREIDASTRGKVLIFDKKTCPLVSVVVTAHNTEYYIEGCLESLLAQDYPRLEIVVVDDGSADATPEIIRRMARAERNIRIFQLASNLGTYYAKNLGIIRSSGQVVFFQDSDDICHPSRISILMGALKKSPQSLVVRGAYSRVDPLSERIVPVNGLSSKLGLITLGVRREVFASIGYFNCTTKASDDEFFNRVIRYLGKARVVDEALPLYYNTMREGSLFADMIQHCSDGSIEQKPSAARMAYVNAYREVHLQPDALAMRKRFSFPRIRDAIIVAPGMSKLSNPEVPVVVSVCSIPEREAKLQITLRSIAPQCDRLHIYLDRYQREPEFLRALGIPVSVVRSQERPGLRDNGKFIALEDMARAGDDAYYFTIDDDIEYPVDYVNTMVNALKHFEDAVVVGLHGVTIRDRPTGYFSDRRIVQIFNRGLELSRFVNILGTGTTAMRASRFDGFKLSTFEYSGMADIYLAMECFRRTIPQLCLRRPDNWLRDLNEVGEVTLFSEFNHDDRVQTRLLQSMGPWGMEGIQKIVHRLAERNAVLAEKLQAMVPLLRGTTRTAKFL